MGLTPFISVFAATITVIASNHSIPIPPPIAHERGTEYSANVFNFEFIWSLRHMLLA